MLPKEGRTLPLLAYLPAVGIDVPEILDCTEYLTSFSFTTSATSVGSHASLRPGVEGLSPWKDPSGLRALFRWGFWGLLLLLSICHLFGKLFCHWGLSQLTGLTHQ